MLRHLFVTQEYLPHHGGIGRYLANIAERLPRGSVVVLTLPYPGSAEYDRKASATIHRAPFFARTLRPRWLKLFPILLCTVRREKINIIHVGQVLHVGTITLLLHWLTRIPYTVSTHGMDVMGPRSTIIHRWFATRVLRGAARVLTNTDYTKNIIKLYGVPDERIIVLLPACSITADGTEQEAVAYRSALGLDGARIVLSVGRLVPRKGFDTLINVVGMLAPTMPDLHLVIAGEGPGRSRLEALIHAQHLEGRVHLLGAITDTQLKDLYRLCTLFAMIARADDDGKDVEGFGVVYLEANTFGKPVIAGSTGGVAEAVVDGETGLIVDPHDPKATAQAIRRLLGDPELARRMGERGKRRVEEYYTWAATMRPFVAWLATLEKETGQP